MSVSYLCTRTDISADESFSPFVCQIQRNTIKIVSRSFNVQFCCRRPMWMGDLKIWFIECPGVRYVTCTALCDYGPW